MTARRPVVDGRKQCCRCSEWLPVTEFYYKVGKPGSYCKPCSNKKCKEYRDSINAGERIRVSYRYGYDLDGLRPAALLRMGFSEAEVDEIVETYRTHSRTCDICGVPEEQLPQRLHVDHDHYSGKFRGFLCMGCNHLLGKAQDSPEILAKAIEYLRRADG